MSIKQAEAALASTTSTITVDDDGCATVEFRVPAVADANDRNWDERWAEYEAACKASPEHAECNAVHSLRQSDKQMYSARLLDGATVMHLPVVTSERGLRVSPVEETYTFFIETRWVIVSGGIIAMNRGGSHKGWHFDTQKEAEATLRTWTKAADEEARDVEFVKANLKAIEALAGRTAGFPAPGADTQVGDTVLVHGHGKARVGIVAEVSKARVKVAWTTPAAVKSGAWPVINWHKKS